MQIRATYTTQRWVRTYLTIWQGMLGFSERELDVLFLIVERHLHLLETVLDVSLQAEMLLSTAARTTMRTTLGMSTNHFQNTLTSLGEKRAIQKAGNGYYALNPKLVPQQELTFTFTIQE